MSKKARKTRATAAEVVKSFTREDIMISIEEARELNTQVAKTRDAIKAMQEAKMDEGHIDIVRQQVDAGLMKRRAYLNSKLRRVALALFRANTSNFADYILQHADEIPTANEKMAKAAFVMNATEV